MKVQNSISQLPNNDSQIIIYDHNDSGQYYNTMILAYLALARSVKYDSKVKLQIWFYLIWLLEFKSLL